MAMVESPREVCVSVRVGGKNPMSVWWNDEVKAAVKRKDAAWNAALGARDEEVKERCLEVHKEENRKVKSCIYQSKNEVNKQFGRKMNQDVNGNRKLFWEEASKVNRGKMDNCRTIKNGNGRLVLGEVEVQRIWKEYFEDLYNIYIYPGTGCIPHVWN